MRFPKIQCINLGKFPIKKVIERYKRKAVMVVDSGYDEGKKVSYNGAIIFSPQGDDDMYVIRHTNPIKVEMNVRVGRFNPQVEPWEGDLFDTTTLQFDGDIKDVGGSIQSEAEGVMFGLKKLVEERGVRDFVMCMDCDRVFDRINGKQTRGKEKISGSLISEIQSILLNNNGVVLLLDRSEMTVADRLCRVSIGDMTKNHFYNAYLHIRGLSPNVPIEGRI